MSLHVASLTPPPRKPIAVVSGRADSLSEAADRTSGRAEIIRRWAAELRLSLRDLERGTGLGRSTLAELLTGTRTNPQYLLFVEEVIRREAIRSLGVVKEVLEGAA